MIRNNLLTKWFVICIPISYEQVIRINNVDYPGIRVEPAESFDTHERFSVYGDYVFPPVSQEYRFTIILSAPLIFLQAIINDINSNMVRPNLSYQINFRLNDTYIMLNNLNSLIVLSRLIIELNSGGKEIKWELGFVINNPHTLAIDIKTGEYYNTP